MKGINTQHSLCVGVLLFEMVKLFCNTYKEKLNHLNHSYSCLVLQFLLYYLIVIGKLKSTSNPPCSLYVLFALFPCGQIRFA